jgi:ribosomal protein S18 acetylase RimI-like enzyme
MQYLIREMVSEDIEQVQAVAKSSWNATYEGIIPRPIQEKFLNLAYSDQMMKRRLRDSLLMVAVINQEIVGFCNFSSVTAKGEAELAAIYLYPDSQSKGMGTALLHEGIKNLHGVKHIYINVEKENEVGRTFYEAKGFKVIKEYDDNFEGHILKTVRMVLTL